MRRPTKAAARPGCLRVAPRRASCSAQPAVVVAFHRVHDGERSRAACRSAGDMFERYCRFFSRHFQVVPLRRPRRPGSSAASRSIATSRSRSTTAIATTSTTRRRCSRSSSLPATFFVVSQWIGSDVVPWWDREQGVRHPWMTWDQVRIAAPARIRHRRAHAHPRRSRRGRRRRPPARRSSAGGSSSERQLGEPVDLFAYPYGATRQHAPKPTGSW